MLTGNENSWNGSIAADSAWLRRGNSWRERERERRVNGEDGGIALAWLGLAACSTARIPVAYDLAVHVGLHLVACGTFPNRAGSEHEKQNVWSFRNLHG
jgi:hypothetical protein